MSRKTISLNGTWDVIFDDNEKLKADCFKTQRKTHAVEVPGVWEQARPFYDGQGFYRRKFTLPANLEGKLLHLKFGAVNYFAEVFLNGKKLGQHEGGYTPFVFDITKTAKLGGDNELVVRVIDPPRKRKIESFRSGAPLSQS
ncbi:MAG: beta galactosidase jelly roll domain-containing protein, partial [Planctomycetes bacterium]|nr:beta galactosidase jelly roll domain-containing protein [Planctomycetota bacterium]